MSLLSSSSKLCIGMDCEDRFGAYGIVGFASVDEMGERPTVRDLVLSCRVAQKRVEHSFIQWLACRARAKGSDRLLAAMVITDRNQPIRQVFDDLGFEPVGDREGMKFVQLTLDERIQPSEIVRVEATEELSGTALTASKSETRLALVPGPSDRSTKV